MSVPESSGTPGVGGKAFACTSSSSKDTYTRVLFKQRGVDDALLHATKIRNELCGLGDEGEPADTTAISRENCGKELVAWMVEIGLSPSW